MYFVERIGERATNPTEQSKQVQVERSKVTKERRGSNSSMNKTQDRILSFSSLALVVVFFLRVYFPEMTFLKEKTQPSLWFT